MILHRDSALITPSNIINVLNLFAGQLYIASKTAYKMTRQMLGFKHHTATGCNRRYRLCS